MVAIAGCGLLHLTGGRPGLDAPTDDLVGAGGLLGVAAAGPLASGLAPWGAGLILGTVALAGLVVLTRVPVRVAAESTADGLRPAGAAIADTVRRLTGNLFSLGGAADDRASGPSLFDQDADSDVDRIDLDDPDAAPRRKPGPRKPKVLVPEPDEPVEATQLEIELGPAVKGSPWKLPPPSILHTHQHPRGRQGRHPRRRSRARRRARPARGRDEARRHGGRSVGHPLRARARARGEGGPRHQPPQGHRLRDGVARRPDPRADPRPPGDRHRGAEHRPPDRGPRRHPRVGRGPARQPPARGGGGPRHQRQGRDDEPRHHAPPPHRRRHRCGQVELPQLAHHVDPHAVDARPGADDPRRPEAGRDGPVRPPAPPAHPGRHQPEEGRQRAGLGGARDGAALRPAGRGRLPRHHRLQRRPRPRRPARRGVTQRRGHPLVPAAAVHPRRDRRAGRPDDGRGP